MTRTTLTCFLLSSASLFAQENEKTPVEWQQQNPRVVCMNQSDYSQLSTIKKDMLGTDILLFDGELTMGDIEKYEAAKMQTIVSKIQYAENFTGELKSWVFEHPDVKIIRRSRYNSLSTLNRRNMSKRGP